MSTKEAPMTPLQLTNYLKRLVAGKIMTATMVWGPPGIGKSSVVGQVAKQEDLALIDLRLGQLAPTDLRGLPVPKDGISAWFPPSFLPDVKRHGPRGILFLDEFNMAPPVVQGIAQQLVLDRRVGDYVVPPEWFIWSAGNRKEDKASVFEMSPPLANRFLHLFTGPDFEVFQRFMIEKGFAEEIIAYLSFAPSQMYQLSQTQPNWPSPRSWEVANNLFVNKLAIGPSVGPGVEGEFEAFLKVRDKLSINGESIIDMVLQGRGESVPFPEPKDVRYALVSSLAIRMATAEEGINCFEWIMNNGPDEFLSLFNTMSNPVMNMKKIYPKFAVLIAKKPKILDKFKELNRMSQSVTLEAAKKPATKKLSG